MTKTPRSIATVEDNRRLVTEDERDLVNCSALEWKYLDNISVREIGEKLSLGPKAAESLLTRARRAFRSTYEQLAIGHRASGGQAPSPVARAGGSDGE